MVLGYNMAGSYITILTRGCEFSHWLLILPKGTTVWIDDIYARDKNWNLIKLENQKITIQ